MPKNHYIKWGLLVLVVSGVGYYASALKLDGGKSGEVALGVSESPVVTGQQMQHPRNQNESLRDEGRVLEAAAVHRGESEAPVMQHAAPQDQLAAQLKPTEENPLPNEVSFLPGMPSEDIFISADESDGLTESINDEQINLGEPLDPDAAVSWQLSAADDASVTEIGESLDPEGNAWMFEVSAVNVAGEHIGSFLDPDNKEAITNAQAPAEEVINIGEHIDLDLPH